MRRETTIRKKTTVGGGSEEGGGTTIRRRTGAGETIRERERRRRDDKEEVKINGLGKVREKFAAWFTIWNVGISGYSDYYCFFVCNVECGWCDIVCKERRKEPQQRLWDLGYLAIDYSIFLPW